MGAVRLCAKLGNRERNVYGAPCVLSHGVLVKSAIHEMLPTTAKCVCQRVRPQIIAATRLHRDIPLRSNRELSEILDSEEVSQLDDVYRGR